MNRVEFIARLLQWRLLARRRPPARWFGGASSGGGSVVPYLENEYSGAAAARSRGAKQRAAAAAASAAAAATAAAAAVAAASEAFGGGCCHHRQLKRPAFPEASQLSQLSVMAVSCPELLEQIFHYVRSRELRAVTLLGRAFKYQLDCQEIWRQLYFLRFSNAFGKFSSWKAVYIQRDERCDRIKNWRAFFERSAAARQQQQQQQQQLQGA